LAFQWASDRHCRRCHRGAGHLSSRSTDTFALWILPCVRTQYVRPRSKCALAVLVASQVMSYLYTYLICCLTCPSPDHFTSTRYHQDYPEPRLHSALMRAAFRLDRGLLAVRPNTTNLLVECQEGRDSPGIGICSHYRPPRPRLGFIAYWSRPLTDR
jgi:hypothetical protein